MHEIHFLNVDDQLGAIHKGRPVKIFFQCKLSGWAAAAAVDWPEKIFNFWAATATVDWPEKFLTFEMPPPPLSTDQNNF